MATNSFTLQGVEKRAKDFAETGVRDGIGTGLKPGVEQRAQERFQGPQLPKAGVAPAVPQLPAVAAPATPAAAPSAGLRMMAPTNEYSGPIHMRPRRQSGRSGLDPNRIAERMARRGDPRALLNLSMQQQDQDFRREMADRTDVQRAAERREDRDDRLSMFNLGQQADVARDERRMSNQLRMFDMEGQRRSEESATDFARRVEENKRQEEVRREERGDPTKVTATPIPGTNFVIPFAGTTAMGTLPTNAEQPITMMPIPGTGDAVPAQGGRALPGLPMFTQDPNATGPGPARMIPKEKAERPPPFQYEKDVEGRIIGAFYQRQNANGEWELVRANIVDANNNGVPDELEGGAVAPAQAAAPAQGQQAAPQRPSGTSTGGAKFSVRQQQ